MSWRASAGLRAFAILSLSRCCDIDDGLHYDLLGALRGSSILSISRDGKARFVGDLEGGVADGLGGVLSLT